MSRRWGLGEDWDRVIKSIEAISDIYDEVNRTISFRRDMELRAEGIDGRLSPSDLVLDAGAGNGIFSRLVLQRFPEIRGVVMLDASLEMLSRAKARLDGDRAEKVLGLFEYLPFRHGCFDACVMGFSLRDARDMEAALREIARTLKSSGRLVVVDLGKPDSRLKSSLITLYWLALAPAIATLRFGRKGLQIASIYPTYKRHPRNSQLEKLLANSFSRVEIKKKMLDGVVIAYSERPAPPTRRS